MQIPLFVIILIIAIIFINSIAAHKFYEQKHYDKAMLTIATVGFEVGVLVMLFVMNNLKM